MKLEKEYKGIKTQTTTNVGVPIYKKSKWWEFCKPEKVEIGRSFPKRLDKTITYYEKAFDKNGAGINLGDKVKVVSIENNPEESLGKVFEVKGVFEGDLMLGDNGFYCWPRNVVMVKKANH